MNDTPLTRETLRALLRACDYFTLALSEPRSAYGKQQAASGAELLDWLMDMLPRSGRLAVAQEALSTYRYAPSKATIAAMVHECNALYIWCEGCEAAQRRFSA